MKSINQIIKENWMDDKLRWYASMWNRHSFSLMWSGKYSMALCRKIYFTGWIISNNKLVKSVRVVRNEIY